MLKIAIENFIHVTKCRILSGIQDMRETPNLLQETTERQQKSEIDKIVSLNTIQSNYYTFPRTTITSEKRLYITWAAQKAKQKNIMLNVQV